MRPRRHAIFVLCLLLTGYAGSAEAARRDAFSKTSRMQGPNAEVASPSSRGQKQRQAGGPQSETYTAYLEAEKRAEEQLFEATPGTSRFWLTQLECIRRRIDEFGGDLAALKKRQIEFERSLTAEQKSSFDAQLRRIHGLSDDIQRDFQSLQKELHNGSSTRWHVDADTWHMYKELGQWKKLNRGIAIAAGIGHQRAPN